jgi:hypothetical protein
MNCAVCGAPAQVHVTNCYEGAPEQERHAQQELCFACAQRLIPDLPEAKDTDQLPRLRQLLAWIKTNNRMPSAAELNALGAAGDLSAAQPGSKEFAEQVRYFEDLIAFLEQHNRFPSEGELPDPFLAG